jgi:hypothetical protein
MTDWDWVTISALATAAGTLVLAAATYASVRSAHRAARVAERTLLAELRPLLVESSEQDPAQHINFIDVASMEVAGGTAAVEVRNGNVYVILSLRNVGPGIGVLHGGRVFDDFRGGADLDGPTPVDQFRMLTRDIYIPAGKIGFWQIAFRDREDEERREILAGIEAGSLGAEVLYGDYEGGQRTTSRFRLLRQDDGVWHLSSVRHWQHDRDGPR